MALEIRRLRKKKKSVRDMHSPFTTTVQNTNGLTIVFGSSGLIIMNEKRILFFLLLFCMDIEYEKKKKKKGNPIVIIAGNRSIPSSHTRDTFYSQLSWPWLTQVAYSVRSAAYRKPTQDEAQPDDLRSTTVRAMHAYTKVCSAHCADRILVSTMGCRFG